MFESFFQFPHLTLHAAPSFFGSILGGICDPDQDYFLTTPSPMNVPSSAHQTRMPPLVARRQAGHAGLAVSRAGNLHVGSQSECAVRVQGARVFADRALRRRFRAQLHSGMRAEKK